MLSPRDGIRPVQAQLEAWIDTLPLDLSAVVVVGSRARGTHFSDSDIDVVVVSPDFAGASREDRIETLLQGWRDRPALEPLGFTPEELDGDSLYLWEALPDGVALRDDGTWEAARERHLARRARGELIRTDKGWRQPVVDSTSSL